MVWGAWDWAGWDAIMTVMMLPNEMRRGAYDIMGKGTAMGMAVMDRNPGRRRRN